MLNGSVVKRGNVYAFVYMAYSPDGERKQICESGFSTKREAEARQREFNRKLRPVEPLARHVTLSTYLTNWINTYAKQKVLAQNTINGYRVNIFKHIIPSIGNYCLDEITASVLDILFADLTEKGLSGTSQHYVYSVLHKAFETGVKRRELPYNYCNMIEAPHLSKFSPNYLDSDGILLFSTYLFNMDIRYSLPLLFGLYLGLRRGEVLGMKWTDIDMLNGVLHVQRTATPGKSGLVFSDCKTEKSNRYIQMPDIIIEKLEEWNSIQIGFNVENPESLVFMQETGKVFSCTSLSKHQKKALDACGLSKMRFHDLRHSFASYLVSNNVPINTVSQMLGHSKTSTTLDIYSHADIKMQRSAIEKLNKIGGSR